MDVFRRNGFDGTSMEALGKAMGMGSQSIYNSFGNKEQVFLAALDHYCSVQAGSSLDRLEARDSDVADIRELFAQTAKAIKAEQPLCLVLTTATSERACARDGVAARTEAHLRRLERAFEKVIRREAGLGKLECADPRLLALYLHMCMHGLIVVARGRGSKRELTRLVDMALLPLGAV